MTCCGLFWVVVGCSGTALILYWRSSDIFGFYIPVTLELSFCKGYTTPVSYHNHYIAFHKTATLHCTTSGIHSNHGSTIIHRLETFQSHRLHPTVGRL